MITSSLKTSLSIAIIQSSGVFQAKAGTSFDMNLNEVIANRALEISGKEKDDAKA